LIQDVTKQGGGTKYSDLLTRLSVGREKDVPLSEDMKDRS